MKTKTINSGIRMDTKGVLWFTVFVSVLSFTIATDPKFDPSTRMRLVLVPSDASVGTVIYRLRATDEEFDYPLTFELIGDSSSSTVQIDSLPCTKYNSVCQANVVLTRRLEAGRYYDFQVSVKDTKGGMASQSCSLTATNFTTPHDVIFPHKPGIIMIPEDAKRGTELDYVISRKNPLYPKPVYLELWGSPLFAIRQKIVSPEMTEGTIFLLGPLDFEKQAMYHLTILANDAYAEPGQDTRNIAGLEVVVIVEDVQDMAPIFTTAPPVTRLPSGLLPGDKILQVHAEDGDKGAPRDIRYGLVSEGNPFTSFFDINDTTGEIFLLRPLDEISAITHIGDPVLLTIVAEEVKVTRDEPPSMATTVQIAFLLPERSNSPPYFENDLYVARVEENSPQGTTLVFPEPYITQVSDDDTGKNGVFSLTLLGNNGTFEITPNVAERQANFLIRVRDNQMLDYEESKYLHFQILAQELGPATNLSAIANVTVYIIDVNDNAPVFTETIYTAELPENMTTGTRVTQVHADDIDTGIGGRVRYTQILGYLNTSLNLDAATGMITVSTDNHGFDREQMPEYHFYVEVRDADGNGNRAQVPLVIKLIDVNDEEPIFERALYEFILASDLKNFTVPAFIKAIDNDAEPPNNVIRYELLQGNYENKFQLHTVTGELTLREPLNFQQQKNVRRRRRRQTDSTGDMQMLMLTARAFDLGVPVKWSTTIIKVYPPESRIRAIAFIVPGLNPDRKKTEETLSAITGGRVSIQDIRPYTGKETDATDIGGNSKERSVVLATVMYDSNSLVDIAHIQKNLQGSNTGVRTTVRDDESAATVYKAENRVLFWLLIFLAIMIALIILSLLFCCICSWCPLYAGSRKRVIRVNSTEDDVHLVHREQGIGKESKSVQVAEWMGRREAWSAERSASDPRTKPTRWEFSRRNNNREKLGHDNSIQVDDDNSEKDLRITSAETKRINKRKHNKEISTAKEIQLHNSRTNLVVDRDVYIEDVNENNDYQSVRRGKHNEIDDDSMRRHEMDRGSEIEYGHRSSLKRQPAQDEQNLGTRDQLFIKEGNAEILRLVTRGKTDDENIYVNVPQQRPVQNVSQPQYIMLDNMGKDILMRRYIEEQSNGKQVIREHYQVIPSGPLLTTQNIPNEVQNTQEIYLTRSHPGSVIYANQQLDPNVEVKMTHQVQQSSRNLVVESDMQQSTSHHSMIQQELENSLKQQNALLRQILLEKEKLEEKYNQHENLLETQSLPGHSMAIATQTDCETGTQTDQLYQKPERRRARSENDDSLSEDEYEYVRYSPANSPDGVYYIKRKRHKKRSKYKDSDKTHRKVVVVERRIIRTPIQEENEEPPMKTPPIKQKETRASMLRRLKNKARIESGKEKAEVKTSRNKSPSLSKDILMEITDSLDEKIVPKIKEQSKYIRKTHTQNIELYEETDNDSDSNSEIAQDSLEEEQSEEEEKLRKKRKKSGRNISFSEPGSSTEAQISITPDLEFNRRKSSISSRESKRSNNIDKNEPSSPRSRVSRRDSVKETIIKTKVRRQAASEPSSRQKGPAPKPPDGKLRKSMSEKTQSEMDILKKLADEGVDVSKGIPRYMEWYFNLDRKQSDDQKSNSDRSRVSSKGAAALPIKKSNLKKGGQSSKSSKSSKSDDTYEIKIESITRTTTPTKNTRLLKEDIQMAKNLSSQHYDTNHPRFQHSEHRFEHDYNPGDMQQHPSKLPHYLYPETPPSVNRDTKSQMKNKEPKPKPSPIKEGEVKISRSRYSHETSDSKQKLNASTLEDDHDSGIAMNSLLHSMGRRNPIADKKSIFTIAYDDVKINKIRSENDTPPI